MFSYYTGLEIHLIVIFCEKPKKYFREKFKCWNSEHYLYFFLSIIYLVFKFFLCLLMVVLKFSKDELNSSATSKFIISNHLKVLLFVKSISLILFSFHKKYSKTGIICFFFICISSFLLYYTHLEFIYQNNKNLQLTIHLFLSLVYTHTCLLLMIGYLIKNTSFKGLIYILFLLILYDIIYFFILSDKEVKIDLNNIIFKEEFHVYKQLMLLSNSIGKMKNDRKSMLNIASYFRKNEDVKIESSKNDFIESVKNENINSLVYKYIEQTYKSMINKYENSVILKIGYAIFLSNVLKKVDKSYIILKELVNNNYNDLTLSQSYYIYIITKHLQNLSFENSSDKSNITLRYEGNQLINLISQVSEIYYQFWTLLLNSKENQNINILRKLGGKINKLVNDIDYRFEKFKKLKVKEKQIFLLYSNYKRDILNDFTKIESEEEVIELDDFFSQTINNSLNINQLISTSSFQFLIVTLKQDNFGTIIKISEEICNHLGYSSEELIGQNMNILIPDFIIKKHEEFILEQLKKIKFLDSYQTALKEHIFFLKTSSKFLFPIGFYVGMLYDEDNKPFIFAKVNFDVEQLMINNLSYKCHILTNNNLIIQNFTSNSLNLLNFTNKIINNNIDITYYIKEFGDEFIKVIMSFSNMKNVDKLKIKLTILKKYFTDEPEEIVTFNKVKCRIKISKLIIRNEVLGYYFDLIKINHENHNENIKANYLSCVSIYKSKSSKYNNESKKNINQIKNSKTKKVSFQEIPIEFKDITFNFLPENRQFDFDFENKEYYFNNNTKYNNKEDKLINYIRKEYLEKKLQIEEENSSSSNSSSSYEPSEQNSYSNSYESSFSSNDDKNLIKINLSNNSIDNNINNDNYYHVKLNKITLFIYDFVNNNFIELPKFKKGKVEEIILIEEKIEDQIKEKKNEPLTKEEKIQIGKELVYPQIKRRNQLFYIKNKSYFYQKIYSKNLSKSILILMFTELFHIIVIALSGLIFFIFIKKNDGTLHNIILVTKYLIDLSENINHIFSFSFFLVLIQNEKYINYIAPKEIVMNSTKQELLVAYKETSELINSVTHFSYSKKTRKKINQLNLTYFVINEQLELTEINNNILILIKELNYAVFNIANTDEKNINFYNLDYNFIFYNSNSEFLKNIHNFITLFITEYNNNLHFLITSSWAFVIIILLILFLCILISLKGFLIMTQEKEKYLKYFFQINQDYIKYNLLKCKKYVQLNKVSNFDSKYFISNPKIKFDDDNSEYSENDENIKLLEEKNLKQSYIIKKHNKKFPKSNLVSDKKNLKKMGLIYILYIIILMSFLSIIMVINKKTYYDISHSLTLYYILISEKTIVEVLFNYLRIYVVYSCVVEYNSKITSKIQYLTNYFDTIFETYKEYKDLIEEHIKTYGLKSNSSKAYNKIQENSLCYFYSYYEQILGFPCDKLADNITNYNMDSLMIYYLHSMVNIYANVKISLKIAFNSGFYFNELLYGTEFYSYILPNNTEDLKRYNEINPFNIFNSYAIGNLSLLNEVVIKPAFNYFSEAIYGDIESLFHHINYIGGYFVMFFFLLILTFNLIYYFPILFKKNKEIKQIRRLLLIIPKDILYKLLIDEDDDETKNKF